MQKLRLILALVVVSIGIIFFLLWVNNDDTTTILRTNQAKGIDTTGSLQVWDGVEWGYLPIGEEGASLVITDGRPSWKQSNDGDKISGNEILNVAEGSPLVREGSGTSGSPFVLDFRKCEEGQVLMYGGGAWACASIPKTTTVISTSPSVAPDPSSLGDSIDGLEIIDEAISANDIAAGAVGSSEIADNTILFADINQNGCAVNQIFKWDGTTWACATDNAGAGGANSFETITTPSGTSPIADSATDILTLAAGAGVTITGVGATDSITIAVALGTAIDSSEITDGTILFTDIGQNSCGASDIIKWNGSAWACATDNVNDADSSATNELQNIFQTVVTSSGTSPVADGTTDTLNFVGGSGVTVTGDGTTDAVTVAAVLGTDITSGEIVDGTIANIDVGNGTLTFAKFASNSCNSGEVIEYNGSAWICGIDGDTTYSAGTGIGISVGNVISSTLGTAIDSGEITDGTIVANDLAGDSVVTSKILDGTILTADIAVDAIDASLIASNAVGASEIATDAVGSAEILAGAVDNAELATDAVTTGKILNGTILFADIASNSCGSGQIFEYNGSAWICGTDDNSSQNLFETIATPSGTNPVADGFTDTLTLAQGAGVTITGDGTTDTITIATVLGVSVDSSEIVDGSVANVDLANSSLTVTAGTGISGGGAVSLGGSVTLNSTLGTDIVSSEIVDGTITAADVAGNVFIELGRSSAQTDGTTNPTIFVNKTGASGNLLQLQVAGTNRYIIAFDGTIDSASVDSVSVVDGSLTGTDIQDGSVANGDLANSSLTVTAGTGLTGGGAVSLGGTVTLNLANDFGSSIDSSEITNGTITAVDVAGNVFVELGRATAQTDGSTNSTIFVNKSGASGNLAQLQAGASDKFVVNFSGVISTASVDSGSIVNGSVANADLANSSLTVTAGTGLTGGGAVSLGGTVTVNSSLGTAIDNSEITDGTILFADLGQNSCGNNDIIKWNGSAWTCAVDATGGSVNSFETITTTSGTNPVADSATDTLTLSAGTGVTVTGNGATDTITLAAVLGTTVDGSEIDDGTVANTDLANSAVTIVAGSGLTTGGSVSLGGSVTVDIGAGNGITVNANDVTVRALASADALSSTTSSGSGLEVLGTGVGLLQGCADNQLLKWNETTDLWACASDNVNDADADATNELQNLFSTIATPDANNPSADANSDTLTFANGAGVIITSNAGTDTVTFASVLGATIDGSEIDNGSVANADLANSSLTVTAGTGLTGGGAVSLGGTVTLNLANDFGSSVDTGEITNGTITAIDVTGNVFVELGRATAQTDGSTNATIFINKTGASGNLAQLQAAGADEFVVNFAGIISSASVDSGSIVNGSVANGDLANSSLTVTAGTGLTGGGAVSLGGTVTLNLANDFGSSIDSSEITANTITNADVAVDTLNFSELSDSLSLDASTTIALGANNLTTNLDSTGDVIFQDNGVAFLTLGDTGTYDYILDGTDNPAYTITNNGSGNVITNLAGTGDSIFQDNGTAFLTLSDIGGLALVLDATDNPTSTITNNGSGNVTTNLAGTGDFEVQDNGVTFLTLSDTGAFSFTLDAADNPAYTLTNAGSSNVVTDLSGTGDFAVQDNGSSVLGISDAGAVTIDLDATDNPAYTLTNAGSSNVTTNLSGTGDFVVQDNGTAVLTVLDNGTLLFKNSADSTTSFVIQKAGSTVDLFTVDTTNDRVYIGDVTADATGSILVLDTKNNAGDPTGVDGGMYYNSNAGKFRCYQNGAWEDCVTARKVYLTADQANSNATANTMEDVTGLSFAVTSGVQYYFECDIFYTAALAATGSRWALNGPATTGLLYTSEYSASATTSQRNGAVIGYDLPAGTTTNSASTGSNYARIYGYILPSANGTFIVRHASETSGSAITAKAGSNCRIW